MLSLLMVSWLGLLAGCTTCCGTCGTGSSGTGSCGSGSCGSGFGHGGGHGAGGAGGCSHGVCDCALDDQCFTRAPWIQHAPAALGTPVEPIPLPAKELPKLPSGL
jgi:hypothetical protein